MLVLVESTVYIIDILSQQEIISAKLWLIRIGRTLICLSFKRVPVLAFGCYYLRFSLVRQVAIDPGMPICASGIRGQLRFWWRLAYGANLTSQ